MNKEKQHDFTEEYFNEELIRFHGLMGSKSFWKLPEEQRDKAFEALGYIYFHLDENADIESIAVSLQSANYEYMIRQSYINTRK